MKIKFPLYAKILFWFFLNLVFLGLTFLVVARVQFRFGLDALISGRAGERIETASQLLMQELREAPRHEWNGVLKRFSDAYKVEFFLFRGGDQIGGNPVKLPPEVQAKAGEQRGPNQPMRPRPDRENGPPEFNRPPDFEPPPRGGEQPPLTKENQKLMVHTSGPNRYWVIVRTALPNPERPQPMLVSLVAMSNSLSAGGLFFDVTPWIIGGAAVILISVLFWVPLVRGITRSISKITRATEQIAEGQFEVRLAENRKDELGSLGEAINQMAVRLSGFVTGQKRFLGDIAHELCTPIARIQMALGILEQRADEKQMAYLTDLREEVEHMSHLVNELLSFSKASLAKTTIKLQPVSVKQIVEKAIDREAEDTVAIKHDLPEDLQVLAEPELLVRSISNVLRNAIRYAGTAGPITVSANREGEKILLLIEDCGPGIPQEAIAKIFDPFYRLDTSRNRETGGVGLGLAIVKSCIESCGGTVSCENRQPTGLRVIARLAAAD